MANKPNRFDLRVKETHEALQQLLDDPDVEEVLLGKALADTDPVSIGVRRHSTKLMSWYYRSTGLMAINAALHDLKRRAGG